MERHTQTRQPARLLREECRTDALKQDWMIEWLIHLGQWPRQLQSHAETRPDASRQSHRRRAPEGHTRRSAQHIGAARARLGSNASQ